MKEIKRFVFQRETLAQIHAHAREEFPYECCGVILSDGVQEHVRRCKNVQNERHAEDPQAYPRDARTAYLMDPNDLIRIHKEAETQNRPIKAFYHSHPNHPAYFSQKDKADAMIWGEPAYPDAAYIVISVYGQDIQATRAYAWSEVDADFVEAPILSIADFERDERLELSEERSRGRRTPNWKNSSSL